MKSIFRIEVALMLLIAISTTNAIAQTLNTNIEGLVIKQYECSNMKGEMLNRWSETHFSGILINRNESEFKGRVKVVLLDGDNDVLSRGYQDIRVGSKSANSFDITLDIGKCNNPNKIEVSLEK